MRGFTVDIVTVNRNNESISIFFGLGNGTFQYNTTYFLGYGSRPSLLAFGDFNNDAYDDVAVSNDGTNSVIILFGNGHGSFTNLLSFTTGYNTLPYSLSISDFNKDAIPDVVVAMIGSNSIGIISKTC